MLGMHRSGTSAVARILNLLGVYLGPEEYLIKPGFDNPKGFWEHQELTDLNEQILRTLGGHHLDPPILSPRWEKSSRLDAIQHRAQSVITRDFTGAEIWGWKDPRTCLTLPFWQQLLPEMRYVVCLRNPVDVARSLAKRNGLSFAASVQLWLLHVTSALEHTAGKPRILLFFEDLFEDIEAELHRLSMFLGRPVLRDDVGFDAAVEQFIDKELYHHQTALVETISQPELPPSVKALYLALRLHVTLWQKTDASEALHLERALAQTISDFARGPSDPYWNSVNAETRSNPIQVDAETRSTALHAPRVRVEASEFGYVPESTGQDRLEVTFVSHDAGRAGAQRVLITLIEWLCNSKDLKAKIILRRGGALTEEFRRLGDVLEIQPQLETEPEKLKSSILEFCRRSALVYVNTLVPGDIAEILSALHIPVITHAHEMQNAIKRWCNEDNVASLLRVTNRFIAAAPQVAENLCVNHGVDPHRVITVQSFINSSKQEIDGLDKGAIRRARQLPENGFIVFGCGTTEWRKGPDLFINVAHRVVKEIGREDVYFYWIGSDAADLEQPGFEARIQQLGLDGHVAFLGEMVDPREYFLAGDVFLLTSREDPFPLVCLEAADCGLPIVCFESAGGMPDFVKNDAGFVVPLERTDLMADKVMHFCCTPAEQARRGAVARRRVRLCNDVSIAGEQIFREMMVTIIHYQRSALADRQTQIRSLETERTALAERLAQLETALSRSHVEIQVKNQKIHDMEKAQSGLLWNLVSTYRGVKDRCLPAGSRRRVVYDRCLRLIKSRTGSENKGQAIGRDAPNEASFISPSDFLYSIDSLACRAGRVYGWGWLFHKTEAIHSLRLIARTKNALYPIQCQHGVRRDDVSRTHKEARAQHSGFVVLSRLPPEELMELFLEVELEDGGNCRIDCDEFENIVRLSQSGTSVRATGHLKGVRRIARLSQRGIGYLYRGDWKGLQNKFQKTLERSRLLGDSLPSFSLLGFLDQLGSSKNKECLLLVDHNLGGGANLYRTKLIDENLRNERAVLLLFYNVWRLHYCLKFVERGRELAFEVDSLEEMLPLARALPVKEIFLNNTVSFDDPLVFTALLPQLKRATGAELTVAMHDYFALCPSWNLLDDRGSSCGVPGLERCRECLPNLREPLSFWVDVKTIDGWRQLWGGCLQEATRILCFSRSSIELLRRAYPALEDAKIKYQPHTLENFPAKKVRSLAGAPLHIGIVGEINIAKGAAIVADMIRLIRERQLPIKVTVIGSIDGLVESEGLSITGPYVRQELPQILEKAGANVFFVPSIWPETFSYVTAELMEMEVPVACFDLGAQGERVRAYSRGLVIREIEGASALEQLIAFHSRLAENRTAEIETGSRTEYGCV